MNIFRLKLPLFSLQTKITMLVCGVVALALLVTNIHLSGKIATNTQNNLAERATDIARIVAHSPLIVEALTGLRDESHIQNYTSEIRSVTNVEFIVVMDMQGIRKSHPNVDKIGQRFVGGDEALVLSGQEYTSTAEGTLGPSLRAFVPIRTADGRQVGAVSVGILLNRVQQAVDQSQSIIYLAIGLGLAVGVVGALLLAVEIKKTLFGLEPFAIAKLLEERSAMLQSVREGIIAVDNTSRITLVNEEAERLLNRAGIRGDSTGEDVESYVPNTRLKDVLKKGRAEYDQEQVINGITLLTNRVPICVNGEIVGAIATFRDKTEMRQLAEQLTGVRNYAEALRSQTHEFMNKLHVILGMVQLGCQDQLADYINQLAHYYQREVAFVVRHIKDPVLAGFLLGKLSHARENGAELVLSEDCYLPEPANPEYSHELVTIIGNLIDNALDAVKEADIKEIIVNVTCTDRFLSLDIADSGPGMDSAQLAQIYRKGFSTKSGNRGLGLFLVQQSVTRLQGNIEVLSQSGKGTRFVVSLPYESKGD